MDKSNKKYVNRKHNNNEKIVIITFSKKSLLP